MEAHRYWHFKHLSPSDLFIVKEAYLYRNNRLHGHSLRYIMFLIYFLYVNIFSIMWNLIKYKQLIPTSCSLLAIRLCSDRQNTSSYNRTKCPTRRVSMYVMEGWCTRQQPLACLSCCPRISGTIDWECSSNLSLMSISSYVVHITKETG